MSLLERYIRRFTGLSPPVRPQAAQNQAPGAPKRHVRQRRAYPCADPRRGRRLRRRLDLRPSRPGRRPKAPRHVYRRHRRRLRPAPHGLRDHRQRRRRSASRLRVLVRARAERRRLRHRPRQRPRHPHRPAPRGRNLGGRSRAHPPACRRQVQPELLQSFRRPARRRRRRGERALAVDGSPHLARRPGTFHPVRARQHRGPAHRGRPRRHPPKWHRGDLQALHRNLHQGRIRSRHSRTPPARAGFPQFGTAHQAA